MAVILFLFVPHLFVFAQVSGLKMKRETSNSQLKTNVIYHLLEETPVLKDSFKELNTYVELNEDPKASLPSTFTICSAVMREAGNEQVLFSLLGKKEEVLVQGTIFSTHPENKRSTFYYSIQNHAFSTNMTIPIVYPYEWTHSCMALSTESGLVRWVVNGQAVEDVKRDVLKEAASDKPRDLNGKILIGATYTPTGWKSLSHKTSSVNIFASALSLGAMEEITTSENCVHQGDYLSWDESKWTFHGEASLEKEDKSDFCRGKSKFGFYSAPFPSLYLCMQHCEKLKSRSPSVVTEDNWLKLKDFLSKELYDAGHNQQIWLSVTDEEEESVWKDFFNDEVMTHKGPFTGEGPNGGGQENCAVQVSENYWVDWYCVSPSDPSTCICDQKERTYLKLRGLCSKSGIDFLYLPSNNADDITKLVYWSSDKSTISYDQSQKIWFLKTNSITSSVSASTEASHISYALGKHTWLIRNDSYECSKGQPYQLDLKLTGCNDLGEFTCDDGQCIGMKQRCDQVQSCKLLICLHRAKPSNQTLTTRKRLIRDNFST